MRTHWYRLASAGVAMGCVVVVFQIEGVTRTTGGSTLVTLAGHTLRLTVLLAALMTIAPRSGWAAVDRWRRRVVAALRDTDLGRSSRTGRVLVGCGAAAYLTIAGWMLTHPDDPTDDDQGAFLQTATEVQAAGGPLFLVRDLYAGRFTEANRHPLYIGLLSLRPTPTFGRGLSFVLGFATLVLLTWLVWQSRGPPVAGVFCLLLGTNGAFCLFSTRVVCDVLMVLWAGLVFLLVRERSVARAVLIGVVLGLAYLTKGTGLLLFAGTLGWLGIELARRRRMHTRGEAFGSEAVKESISSRTAMPRRSGIRKNSEILMTSVGTLASSATKTHSLSAKSQARGGNVRLRQTAGELAIIIIAWAIVASPLLLRNVREYGTPFYNVNSALLFVDAYEDPVALSEEHSMSEAARAYWQSHSLADVAQREVSGLVWETFIVLRTLGPALLEDARVLFGLPLALCAVMAVVAAPRREQGLLAVWVVLCVIVFAWYVPIAAGDRFPLPLLGPILILAAEGIVRLAVMKPKQRSDQQVVG